MNCEAASAFIYRLRFRAFNVNESLVDKRQNAARRDLRQAFRRFCQVSAISERNSSGSVAIADPKKPGAPSHSVWFVNNVLS